MSLEASPGKHLEFPDELDFLLRLAGYRQMTWANSIVKSGSLFDNFKDGCLFFLNHYLS